MNRSYSDAWANKAVGLDGCLLTPVQVLDDVGKKLEVNWGKWLPQEH